MQTEWTLGPPPDGDGDWDDLPELASRLHLQLSAEE